MTQKAKTVDVWKNLSTPGDPVEGILTALSATRPRADRQSPARHHGRHQRLLERTGAVVAYVTTKGFRDVPFIQRGNRRYHYDISWVKPKPLVKRRHCFEVDERLDAYGEV